MIHPSAVIHPDAQLAANVTIGPYAVVEGAARIGADCVVQAHAVIGAHVVMGEGNVIGYGAVIGGDPQDLAFKPSVQSEVRIGARNRIREHCTIHRGTAEGSATVVGDDCFLMAGTHLGHNVQLGNGVVVANNTLFGGHVTVGDRAFIGGGCVFHQHTRVGRLVICQGMSGFGKDLPPFTIGAEINFLAGLNVVGLRRAGFTRDQRADIKRAFDLVYRSGRNVSQALAAAEKETWGAEAREFLEFIATARKRGVCALMRQSASGAAPDAEGGAS